MGWEDTIEDIPEETKSTKKSSSWEDSIVDLPKEKKASITEALSGGAIKGFSFGLSDELAGLLEAAGTAAGVSGLGGKLKDIKTTEEGPTLDLAKLISAYKTGKQTEKSLLEEQTQGRPVATFLGELAGAAVNPIGQLGKLSEAATTGQKAIELAKAGSKAGALAGFGESEADSIGGLLKDTAIGGTVGAVATPALGLGVPGLFKTGKKIWTSTDLGGDLATVAEKEMARAQAGQERLITKENYEAGLKAADKTAKEVYAGLHLSERAPAVTANEAEEAALKAGAKEVFGGKTLSEIKGGKYAEAAAAAEGKSTGVENIIKTMEDSINAIPKEEIANDTGILTKGINTLKAYGERVQGVIKKMSSTPETIAEAEELAMNKAREVINKELINSSSVIKNQAISDAELLAKQATQNSEAAMDYMAKSWYATQIENAKTNTYNIIRKQVNEIAKDNRKNNIPTDTEALFKKMYDTVMGAWEGSEYNVRPGFDPDTGMQILTAEFIDPLGKKISKSFNVNNIEAFKNIDPIKQPQEFSAALEKLTQQLIDENSDKYTKLFKPVVGIEEVNGQKYAVARWTSPLTGKEATPRKFAITPKEIEQAVATKTEATYQELNKLSDDLSKFINSQESRYIKDAALNTKKSIDDQIRKLSGGTIIEDANTGIQKVIGGKHAEADAINRAIETAKDVIGISSPSGDISEFRNSFLKGADQVKDFILRSQGSVKNDEVRKFNEAMRILEQNGVLSKEQVDSFVNRVGGEFKELHLLSQAYKGHPEMKASLTNLLLLPMVMKEKAYQITSAASYGAGKVKLAAKDISELITGRKLYDMSPEQLKPILDAIGKASPDLQPRLDYVMNQPMAKRRALLFTMQQQPQFQTAAKSLATWLTED